MSQLNCPTCGAKTSSVVANCEYCGVEIARVNTLSVDEYMASIQRRLDNCSSKDFNSVRRGIADIMMRQSAAQRAKTLALAETICLLPLPSNTEALLALFSYCNGHDQPIGFGTRSEKKEEILAWRGKALAAYERLRVMALNNPQLSDYLKGYAGKYSPEAIAKQGSQGLLGGLGKLFGR